MKGNNTITWCHAQMVQAIETYLNEHVLKDPVIVDAISELKDSYKGSFFEIRIASEEDNG